jgi:hypothetical protein
MAWRKAIVEAEDWEGPYQTCVDAATVVRRSEITRRRVDLSFKHHREVDAMTYEQRLDVITDQAWILWMAEAMYWTAGDEVEEAANSDLRMKTEKHVRDTAAKAYADDMTDEEWLAATLKRLDWD